MTLRRVTRFCVTLAVVWACSCGIQGRVPWWVTALVPQAQAATDPALGWARRYDAWQARHKANDRITYIVSHQPVHGLQGIEAQDVFVAKGNAVTKCILIVIRLKPRHANPLLDIVNAGLEDCTVFEAHYRESTKQPPSA